MVSTPEVSRHLSLLGARTENMNLGGAFTMGPREAAIATSWIRPDIAIPMYYNTRSTMAQDPADFQALVETIEC